MWKVKGLLSPFLSKTANALVSVRLSSGESTVPIQHVFTNRNPRNLERLRIAYKCGGYHLENPGRDFWHKLFIGQNKQGVTAEIVHQSRNKVVSASTAEWAVKKFLYSTLDMCAYQNLGRVFALRCLESGITEVRCDLDPKPGSKVAAFLACVEEGGVSLSEPARYLHPRPSDQFRPEKSWQVIEEMN